MFATVLFFESRFRDLPNSKRYAEDIEKQKEIFDSQQRKRRTQPREAPRKSSPHT